MIIGVDFDGTIVEHKYPGIGEPIPRAVETLLELQELEHQLILWTMRSGDGLREALDYLHQRGVELWGVNQNPKQHTWTNSPKAYCQLYIDDAALGCPLTYFPEEDRRPAVDWDEIRVLLIGRGVL